VPGVVGRDREMLAAGDFFDRLEEGPAALVLAGKPGIGKTTLWTEALRLARQRSLAVLSARPVAPEAKLPLTAFCDLLDPAADEVASQLPGPQRHALAVALLREDPGSRRFDQRALGTATISVLTALARTTPVVVAIDDLPWLDHASARVLAFAARRLGQLPVGMLACERIGEEVNSGLDIEHALPEGRVRRLVLGPLSPAALHEVLHARLGRMLPRRTSARVAQAAGGNPFLAVEIARSLPDNLPAGLAVLPVPENLQAVIGVRISTLPARVREALLPAAALRCPSSPSVELIAAGMGSTPGRVRQVLAQAAAAGIVEVDGSRVRFTHPLLPAALYSSAKQHERRRTHLRLAAALEDVEARAWHLALAVEGTDAAVARVLEAAADHARRRDTADFAAELSDQALRLTPPTHPAELQRLRVRAAEDRLRIGEMQVARELLEAALEEAPAGRQHADALRLLGEILYHEQGFHEAIGVFKGALVHVKDDAVLASAFELHLALADSVIADWTGAELHSRRALAMAEQLGDTGQLAEALAVSVILDYLQGRGLQNAQLRRALELEDGQRQTTAQMRPSWIAGQLMIYEGRLGRACDLLSGLRERILNSGQESDLPYASASLAWAECWRGKLGAAVFYADEAVGTASRMGNSMSCFALGCASVPAAYAGDATATRKRASEALALTAATGHAMASTWARWALAVVALSLGDPVAAEAALAPLTALLEQQGLAEPIRAVFLADAIEALVALGQLDRAGRLTALLGQAARRLERGWALAQAERCRALLLAARGDLAGASRAACAAVRNAESSELRLEHARTLLVAGEVERRNRRKAAAHDLLERALEIFESAGARLWAERTRAELDRAASRRTGDSLTESEKLVANLAASGLTNREVAAQLFMSPKTVEANLVRVYRKLGIRSRAELGARLAGTGHGTGQRQSNQTDGKQPANVAAVSSRPPSDHHPAAHDRKRPVTLRQGW
jgi:DNA-binding NarL/FixJ family response regulator